MKDSIEEMLQRWEEEPTPQLSLQLAEEYRQQGHLEEGATILEQALRLHPHHVSARVAYGRFLLDLGRSEEAAQMLCDAILDRPKKVSTRLGRFAQILYAIAPNASDVIANTAYKLLPESAAARGEKAGFVDGTYLSRGLSLRRRVAWLTHGKKTVLLFFTQREFGAKVTDIGWTTLVKSFRFLD